MSECIIIIIIIMVFYYITFYNNYENFTISEPKIIILIISSNNIEYYKNMRDIWKKYMNNHQNVSSFFIENDSSINEEIIVDKKNNIIYYKDEESYIPGILNKTIKVIDYCIKNFDFDYIYRTNLSSVVNFDKLYSYLQNNNNIDYAGHDYAKFIMSELNVNLKIKYDKIKPNGVHRKLLDSSIAKKYGWKPKYSLKKAFRITYVDYLKKKKILYK